jgi:hypothetical protein
MNTLYIAFGLGVFVGFLLGNKVFRVKFIGWIGNLMKKGNAQNNAYSSSRNKSSKQNTSRTNSKTQPHSNWWG